MWSTEEACVSERESERRTRTRCKLSEDWLSVLIGLILVVVVALVGATSIPWPLFGVFS